MCSVCMNQCGLPDLRELNRHKPISSSPDGWAEPERQGRAKDNLRVTPYYLTESYIRRKDGALLCYGAGIID